MSELAKNEEVICLHSEIVDSSTHIGTCKICRQERFYDPKKEGTYTVLKRGFIDGVQTMVARPRVGQRTPAEVTPAPAPAPAPAPRAEELPSPPKTGPGRKKTAAKY